MNWFGFGVLVVVLVAATAFALWRRSTDGRLRQVDGTAAPSDADAVGSATSTATASTASSSATQFPASGLGITLGKRATLVQFSTAFCQPCRATRRVLGEVADLVDGVVAVDVDAEAHLDVVRQLNVMRTPTVFVLDGRGVIVRRASGQPRKADVIAAVGALDRPSSEV